MADVINRTTLELRLSVNTPDFPKAAWIHNPNLAPVRSVPKKYWKIRNDDVVEMGAGEKAAVDAAEAARDKSVNLLLASPNGTRYKLSVDNAGALSSPTQI